MKTYTENKKVKSAASIDRAMKVLASRCELESKAIKSRVEQFEERGRELRKQRKAKKFLKQYENEIPLAKAALDGISIEDASNKINANPVLIDLYRVEGPGQGIWRNDDRTPNEIYKKLSCKNMPMDDSEFYSEGGREWVSSCCNMETLRNWFGEPDGVVFKTNGYKLFKYTVPEHLVRDANPYEKVFCKEDAISRVVVDSKMLYSTWEL